MTGTRERNRLEVERAGRIVDAEAEVRRCEIDVVSSARTMLLNDRSAGEAMRRPQPDPQEIDYNSVRVAIARLDRAMSELARLRVTP